MTSLGGDAMKHPPSGLARLNQVSPTVWETLSRKRIYFGHQSVGANILDGLGRVFAGPAAIRLNIRETSEPSGLARPVLAHSLIGRNADPKSKIDQFREILENGVGRAADMAMIKLCFADIDRKTDIGSLFEFFTETLSALESQFQGLRIIPWTVPLRTMPPGFKPAVKRLFGLTPALAADNLPRHLFNEKLRARNGEFLFDLAKAEAVRPEHRKMPAESGGRKLELPCRAYSSDGGHLNALGSEVIAVDLLLFLARLVSA